MTAYWAVYISIWMWGVFSIGFWFFGTKPFTYYLAQLGRLWIIITLVWVTFIITP